MCRDNHGILSFLKCKITVCCYWTLLLQDWNIYLMFFKIILNIDYLKWTPVFLFIQHLHNQDSNLFQYTWIQCLGWLIRILALTFAFKSLPGFACCFTFRLQLKGSSTKPEDIFKVALGPLILLCIEAPGSRNFGPVLLYVQIFQAASQNTLVPVLQWGLQMMRIKS